MSPYRYPDKTGFPYLNYLLGAYFHQDFEINGNTVEEIIATCKKDFLAEDIKGTVEDIHALSPRMATRIHISRKNSSISSIRTLLRKAGRE
jgi:CdiI immunity protein